MKVEEKLGNKLRELGLTMGTAESCTGGGIAALVTSVSGSSEYFKGGVVSYAVEVKENILGVPEETINEKGVVSEETATAMAKGAQKVLRTDCAVASTGVAGPSGGTPETPVGTIWLAAIYKDKVKTYCQTGNESRSENVQRAIRNVLELLLQLIEESR